MAFRQDASNGKAKTYSRRNSKQQQQDDPAKFIGPCDFREEHFVDKPTLADYTNLAALCSSLPLNLTTSLARRHFRWITGSKLHSTWREEAWQTIMDHFACNCSWRQLRVLSPLRPLRVELKLMKLPKLHHYNYYFGGDTYSARWLCEVPDRTPEDPVILYFHGGSYALKTQRPQITYLAALAKMTAQYRVSILILDYTIGPFAKFPVQLDEGMACYRDLQKSCNQIMVFGDSCGGHLALAMLQTGARFNLGLALISPSTDMTNENAEDIAMREVFVDTDKYDYADPIISPLYADPAIWPQILPKNVALVWGDLEESKPQMIEWGALAKVTHRFEEPMGKHDCMLRGTKNAGSQYIQGQILRWLKEHHDQRNSPIPSATVSASESSASLASTPFSSRSSSSRTSLVDIFKSSSSRAQSEPIIQGVPIADNKRLQHLGTGVPLAPIKSVTTTAVDTGPLHKSDDESDTSSICSVTSNNLKRMSTAPEELCVREIHSD